MLAGASLEIRPGADPAAVRALLQAQPIDEPFDWAAGLTMAAYADDALVGIAVGRLFPDSPHRHALFEHLILAPTATGQGLAPGLFHAWATEARGHGVRTIVAKFPADKDRTRMKALAAKDGWVCYHAEPSGEWWCRHLDPEPTEAPLMPGG